MMPVLDQLPPAPPVAVSPPTPEATTELLGFAIGAHRFLASYVDAVEIEQVPVLARVPAAPAWMAGLANLHGGVLSVLDLRALLGEPALQAQPAPGVEAMMLVLRHRKDRVAVLIDGMTRRMKLSAADAHPGAAATWFYEAFVTRAFSAGTEVWHELDYVGFLDGLNTFQAPIGRGFK